MFDQLSQPVTFSRRLSRQIAARLNKSRRRNVQRRTSIFARIPIECGQTLENRRLLSGTNSTDVEPIRLEGTTPDESRSSTTTDSTPTIQWNDVDSTLNYEVWVNEVDVAARQIFVSDLTDPEFTPDQPLDEGLFRFFIRAEFADGTFGDWSSPYDVTVTTSEVVNSNFSDSLTWFPQTDVDQFLTTDAVPIQVILPDSPDNTSLILPETQAEPVLVTLSLPPIEESVEPDKKLSLIHI